MVAAMAGFGFAGHKGAPQLASAQQQQDPARLHGIATQAELQQQPDSSAVARFSRSLLAAVPSSSSSGLGQGAMLQLGGPVTAAAVGPLGGLLLQVPGPGPDKVGQGNPRACTHGRRAAVRRGRGAVPASAVGAPNDQSCAVVWVGGRGQGFDSLWQAAAFGSLGGSCCRHKNAAMRSSELCSCCFCLYSVQPE